VLDCPVLQDGTYNTVVAAPSSAFSTTGAYYSVVLPNSAQEPCRALGTVWALTVPQRALLALWARSPLQALSAAAACPRPAKA